MSKALEYNAVLAARVDLTPSLSRIYVRPDVEIDKRPWFVPGQYCVIGLNNAAQPELGSVRRSMSIASDPMRTDEVEFYVRLVSNPESDNPLTPKLWHLRAGDRLYMRPVAAGVFTIADTIGADDSRLRICVAAGTGLAPFLCMARAEANLLTPRLDRFAILHGASLDTELGYRDELEALARGGLRYVPTVSRPHACPQWTGHTGRVESLFDGDKLAALEAELGLPPEGLIPESCAVLICGLQGTIGNTITALLARRFVPDHRRIRAALGIPEALPPSLFFEQYDHEPVINLKDEAAVARLREVVQLAHGLTFPGY